MKRNNFLIADTIIQLQMIFKNQYFRLFCLICVLVLGAGEQCGPNDEQFLVSFHPHLDAFWLNTDNELKDINFRPASFLYEMNQRNSKTIFNSMYSALEQSPQRKYFVTEMVFFKDWYEFINEQMKQNVKKFIKSGQLEITNGGWVENDEAVCYVDDIIDQYTIGHNFLRQTFGLETRVGWATDSFGHSHSQAAIQHLLGFEAQGIERIDDRYIYKRKNGSLLQFYWSAVSDSNGRKYGGVYTHIRHFLHQFVNYRGENADSLARDYDGVNTIMTKLYKRRKLFRFVGNDFEEFIPKQFEILQSAFENLNKKSSIQCPKYKYGNPSEYLRDIQLEQKGEVPVRQSDFMPNFDQDHYWSGYFTTNPMLKVVSKDFSRLTNLFRKILLKQSAKKVVEDQGLRNLLVQADELLSVMQHHDGITATSKYHIEELFKGRMTQTSDKLLKAITNLARMPDIRCSFDSNTKNCNLQPVSSNDVIYLTVLHQGVTKLQRIQIPLPNERYFQYEGDLQDSIFCNQNKICSLVFDAELKAGENVLKLNKQKNSNDEIIRRAQKQSVPKYQSSQFTVEIAEQTIKYSVVGGDFIHLSLQRSQNTVTMVETETWNKYGQSMRKNERRIPGIYIMANTGKFTAFPQSRFTSLRVAQGKKFIRIWALSQIAQVTITIDRSSLNILDVQTTFKPNSYIQYDYFLKISSPIKSNGQFFHDMNGYLVSKRKIGTRLDYEWNYRAQDKINANTYPMCSFGYITDSSKKLVVFTDRAQGLTVYDDDLLVNIDRLAGDDYKGVGQGYTVQVSNTFKHKIAIISSDENTERLWQRTYDQLTVGFLSVTPPKTAQPSPAAESQSDDYQWLKYTTFSLNKKEFVVRLFNMNEKQDIRVNKFTVKSWSLPELGLLLNFEDVKESFANGNPIATRKHWVQIEGEINTFNLTSQDSSQELLLAPLQIRSFRINLADKISLATLNNDRPQHASDLPQVQLKPLGTHFSRRCF